MKIANEPCNGSTVLHVRAERIDAACAVQFKDAVNAQLESCAPRVILDLADVRFVDSSGLGAIVSIYKGQLGHRQIDLCCLSTPVEKVFKLTRMDQVFVIFSDMDTALNGDQAA